MEILHGFFLALIIECISLLQEVHTVGIGNDFLIGMTHLHIAIEVKLLVSVTHRIV